MLSREVMKAAEQIAANHSYEIINGQSYPTEEFEANGKTLAAHILAHREDYDADWTPLEWSPERLVAMGFVETDSSICGRPARRWHCGEVAIVCEYHVGDEPHYTMQIGRLHNWFRIPPMPQLQALIQSLRGSQE